MEPETGKGLVAMTGNMQNLIIVRVGNVLTYSTLQELGNRILSSFRGIINEYQLKHHDTPVTGSIDAFFLTMVLNAEYHGHTLGITDADLKTQDQDEFYNTIIGGKNPRNDVAVVSTKRLSPERIDNDGDYELLLTRTLKVSLHEIGHNLGLTDHAAYRFGPEGALCPMSKGEFNKFGYQGYVRAVVDGRGADFCDECRVFLKTIYGNRLQKEKAQNS
jgi:predicted Zn-dependent protease